MTNILTNVVFVALELGVHILQGYTSTNVPSWEADPSGTNVLWNAPADFKALLLATQERADALQIASNAWTDVVYTSSYPATIAHPSGETWGPSNYPYLSYGPTGTVVAKWTVPVAAKFQISPLGQGTEYYLRPYDYKRRILWGGFEHYDATNFSFPMTPTNRFTFAGRFLKANGDALPPYAWDAFRDYDAAVDSWDVYTNGGTFEIFDAGFRAGEFGFTDAGDFGPLPPGAAIFDGGSLLSSSSFFYPPWDPSAAWTGGGTLKPGPTKDGSIRSAPALAPVGNGRWIQGNAPHWIAPLAVSPFSWKSAVREIANLLRKLADGSKTLHAPPYPAASDTLFLDARNAQPDGTYSNVVAQGDWRFLDATNLWADLDLGTNFAGATPLFPDEFRLYISQLQTSPFRNKRGIWARAKLAESMKDTALFGPGWATSPLLGWSAESTTNALQWTGVATNFAAAIANCAAATPTASSSSGRPYRYIQATYASGSPATWTVRAWTRTAKLQSLDVASTNREHSADLYAKTDRAAGGVGDEYHSPEGYATNAFFVVERIPTGLTTGEKTTDWIGTTNYPSEMIPQDPQPIAGGRSSKGWIVSGEQIVRHWSFLYATNVPTLTPYP